METKDNKLWIEQQNELIKQRDRNENLGRYLKELVVMGYLIQFEEHNLFDRAIRVRLTNTKTKATYTYSISDYDALNYGEADEVVIAGLEKMVRIDNSIRVR